MYRLVKSNDTESHGTIDINGNAGMRYSIFRVNFLNLIFHVHMIEDSVESYLPRRIYVTPIILAINLP